jgi:hypothetical protein
MFDEGKGRDSSHKVAIGHVVQTLVVDMANALMP